MEIGAILVAVGAFLVGFVALRAARALETSESAGLLTGAQASAGAARTAGSGGRA